MNEPITTTKPESPKVCVTCQHWRLDEAIMECRRRAPTRDLACKACFPITDPLMWCGEWEMCNTVDLQTRKAYLISVQKKEIKK
jgi:hypothetical protein